MLPWLLTVGGWPDGGAFPRTFLTFFDDMLKYCLFSNTATIFFVFSFLRKLSDRVIPCEDFQSQFDK